MYDKGKQDRLCVTSFSPVGYEAYGKEFLKTYVAYVDAPLYVYVEGMKNKPAFNHEKITYLDLWEVDGLLAFLKMADFPAAKGDLWNEGGRPNYRWMTHTFCRKNFAQIDAAHRFAQLGGKELFWLDADIVFRGAFKLPPLNDDFTLYLGRTDHHSCTSFVGWNLSLPYSRSYFKKLKQLYMTGTIFALKYWHDCFVLDTLREDLKLPSKNLANSLDAPAYSNVFDMVFQNARHKKGDLK